MMRKIKEADPIVIDFLKNIFVSNQDEEEGVFETDEEKEDPKVFIPKLFCQVGDKKSGWHSKTVQAFAALLLTILSGGQAESSPWLTRASLHLLGSSLSLYLCSLFIFE